jgi:hypothetical protein
MASREPPSPFGGSKQIPECCYYQQGLCKFGSTCRFRHTNALSPSSNDSTVLGQLWSGARQLLSTAYQALPNFMQSTSPLLELPSDLLRHHIFNQARSGLDRGSQLVCRQVCRRLRDCIEPRRPGEKLDILAASAGYVQFMECLMPRRAGRAAWIPRAELCAAAAASGHLPVLQWLHARGAHWSPAVPYLAAKHGHFELLQWARTNGCRFYEPVTAAAAGRGDLEMLMWLRAHHCPWHEATCSDAAAGGHLHLLQWARKNSCPWDPIGCAVAAARSGELEVLQWIVSHGLPRYSGSETAVSAAAARSGRPHVMEWLQQIGFRSS